VDSLAALAPLFFLCRLRGLFLFGERFRGLLMDAFFSTTFSGPPSGGTFGLGRACPWGACLPWWKYALDFSDVATPVHGHAPHLKQEPGALNRASCMSQLNTRACAGQ